jgi:hypothetical protein
MPSIINSDSGAVTGSAGLKFTSADDGVLQIQNNGNTAISISSGGIATFAQPPLTAVPVFMAYRDGSTQSMTSGANNKIQLNAVEYDTETWFDSTTNYRYTPQIAGYYQFNSLIYVSGTGLTTGTSRIFKNGAVAIDGHFLSTTSATFLYLMATGMLYMNGTTDYVELFGYAVGTTPVAQNDVARTWLQGFLVRAA